MSTASVTNTFVNATTADAGEVNTNFSDLVTFLNGSVLHLDGSKTMTGALAMGSQKITGLAAGTTSGDAARYDELSDAEFETLSFSIPGDLTVTSYGARWYPAYNITISDMVLSVGTAPTGAAILVDVNRSGTTIFTTQGNRPTVAISGFVDTAATPDVTTVTTSQYLTIDVDQVGSTIAGADAILTIRYKRT